MTGSSTHPSRRRILVVEDEESIAQPLAEALAREGFDSEVAGTAAEALERVSARAPDPILLDVMLPDGSGLDVLRSVRATSQVPIIFVTARGDEADRLVGLELGADDYVVKPFSAREVAARIRTVLRRSVTSAAAPTTSDAIEIGDPTRRTVKQTIPSRTARVTRTTTVITGAESRERTCAATAMRRSMQTTPRASARTPPQEPARLRSRRARTRPVASSAPWDLDTRSS